MTYNSFQSIEEFLSGSLLLLDKPYRWTSFDVLNRIKGFVRNNIVIPPNEHGHRVSFKIGHAGTLDPLATGLLVVCTGKYTKQIDALQGGDKEYTGTMVFGQTTPSFDLETVPEGNFPTEHITLDLLQKSLPQLIGDIWQKPPLYSAKKVGGKRAYKAARNGQDMIIPASLVSIKTFEITQLDMPEANFRIVCSKGTYIRSLVDDLGRLVGSGAYLSALRRTASAPFRVEDALSINTLLEKLAEMNEVKANKTQQP